MSTATQKKASELTDAELILVGVQKAVLGCDADFNPTPEEIRSHDCDKRPFGYLQNRHIFDELTRRGLNKRTGRPW